MSASQTTIAEMMRAAGYVTGHVGKWHLGYTPATMPNGQRFDHSFGHMGGCIDNYSHFFYWRGPNRHDLWQNGKEVWRDGQFFPNLMVDECRRFIEQNKDRPFLLYWALNIPHYSLQGSERWRKVYAELPSPRREYAAFVSTLDEKIGDVLETLDRLQLRGNTIVIFQSDHGHSTEVRTFSGGGNAGPYRGAKACLFEGGIRVPAIISWPSHIPQGEQRHQMATGCDWMPTTAELCGAELPTRSLDGKSLVPVLHSKTAASPHSVFHWMLEKQWAVRQNDWKLLGNPRDLSEKAELHESDRRFLVNLRDDVGEMTNLAARHSDMVQRMERLHDDWVEQLSAD